MGLNSHRVLRHGEWHRLGTSALLHSSLPHLVSNCSALALEGLPLERKLGGPGLLALVATTGLLTQGLYRECSSWLRTLRVCEQQLAALCLSCLFLLAFAMRFKPQRCRPAARSAVHPPGGRPLPAERAGRRLR